MFEASSKTITFLTLAALLSPAFACLPAAAQDNTRLPGQQGAATAPEAPGDWSVLAGIAAFSQPKTLGSSDDRTLAAPFVDITYKDRYFLGVSNGLGLYVVKNDFAEIGVSIGTGLGRQEKDDRRLLAGLGDLDSGVGLSTFGSVGLGPVELQGRILYGTGDIEGVSGNLGIGTGLPIGDKAFVGLSASTSWASEDVGAALFGVTSNQATDRAARRNIRPDLVALSPYLAGDGFYEATLELSYTQVVGDSWIVIGSVGYSSLLGDAADSPLSPRDEGVTVGVILLRNFSF